LRQLTGIGGDRELSGGYEPMALLSDRDSFDRLICQRIYFTDAIGKLVARITNDDDVAAINAYARWRAFDDTTSLDSCFDGILPGGVNSDRAREIIDAVNGIWDDSRP
jgi:hypothetical protein